MGAFVDAILGGSASFQRLPELLELEPPYLLGGEGAARTRGLTRVGCRLETSGAVPFSCDPARSHGQTVNSVSTASGALFSEQK